MEDTVEVLSQALKKLEQLERKLTPDPSLSSLPADEEEEEKRGETNPTSKLTASSLVEKLNPSYENIDPENLISNYLNHSHKTLDAVFNAGRLIGLILYICFFSNKLKIIHSITHPQTDASPNQDKVKPWPDFFQIVFVPFFKKFQSQNYLLNKNIADCLSTIFNHRIRRKIRQNKMIALFNLLSKENFFRNDKNEPFFQNELENIKDVLCFSEFCLSHQDATSKLQLEQINHALKNGLANAKNIGAFFVALRNTLTHSPLINCVHSAVVKFDWPMFGQSAYFPLNTYKDYFSNASTDEKQPSISNSFIQTSSSLPSLLIEAGFKLLNDPKQLKNAKEICNRLLGSKFPTAPDFKSRHIFKEKYVESTLRLLSHQFLQIEAPKIGVNTIEPRIAIYIILNHDKLKKIQDINPEVLFKNICNYLPEKTSQNAEPDLLKSTKNIDLVKFWTLFQQIWENFLFSITITKSSYEELLKNADRLLEDPNLKSYASATEKLNTIDSTDWSALALIRLLRIKLNLETLEPPSTLIRRSSSWFGTLRPPYPDSINTRGRDDKTLPSEKNSSTPTYGT